MSSKWETVALARKTESHLKEDRIMAGCARLFSQLIDPKAMIRIYFGQQWIILLIDIP